MKGYFLLVDPDLLLSEISINPSDFPSVIKSPDVFVGIGLTFKSVLLGLIRFTGRK